MGTSRTHRPHRLLGVVRIARAVLYTILTDPYVIVAVTLAFALLVHIPAGRDAARNSWREWSFQEIFSCTVCLVAMMLLAVFAAGHVILSFIANWRESKPPPVSLSPR